MKSKCNPFLIIFLSHKVMLFMYLCIVFNFILNQYRVLPFNKKILRSLKNL